ncbi:MAG: penicillin-binding protein 2 [Actinobacteria bacterium]|nr:penicillin-binding protein 2 [Actinomycetota bacterium]MCB9412299.1 penicillin-binding protein 2 [Actinomycetota bacterium]
MSATRTPPSGATRRPPGRPSRTGGRTWYQRFRDGDLTYRRGSPVKRMRMMSLVLVFITVLSLLRLIQVQIIDTGALAQRAESARLATTPLMGQRGTIYDINGMPLAQSVDAYNLAVDQTLVEDPSALAAELAPILESPEPEIEKSLVGDARFAYVQRFVTPEQASAVRDLEEPALGFEQTLRREYPGGDLAANVIGYVGVDGHGLAGVEISQEDTLAGVDGLRTVEVADGKLIPTATDELVSPQPGESLRLTLDQDLQYLAQDAISRQVAASRAESGTVIVMEVKTGRILAMASVPTVDANDPAAGKPEDLQNRAVVEAFEPGSTSKIMTMAAVINEGKADPLTHFTVKDSIDRGTRTFRDHDPHPTYEMTLAGILAKSSNTGSIEAAELIGEEKFYEYLRRFGVGDPTGAGFPGEASGYVPPTSEWTDSTFPTLAFGQGLSVSALQITSIFQTIANDGVRIQPHIVESTIDPDGEETPAEPAAATKVVEPETAEAVLKMMEGVVSPEGTANNAAIPGYRVGGKTGTANRIDDSCGCYRDYTASFIGVAPADDPELVAAVIVQDPKGTYMGSSNGAPVFKEVMTAALISLGIPPTNDDEPLLPIFVGEQPGNPSS